MPEAVVEIDAELKADALTIDTMNEISLLEPFGKGNPFPKFVIFDANVAELRRIGDQGKHLRLRIGENARQAVTAVGWSMGDLSGRLRKKIDAVFELAKNEWNGRVDPQLVLEEIRPSEGDIS